MTKTEQKVTQASAETLTEQGALDEPFTPRLVAGLKFSVKENGDQIEYTLEDSYRDRFFRIGAREFDFIIQLDGRQQLGMALAHVNLIHDDEPLSQDEAGEIILWLLKEQLVQPIDSGTSIADTGADTGADIGTRFARFLSKINLLFIRVPLINPDRFLSHVVPGVSKFLGWPLMLLWVVVVGSGAFQLLTHWREFSQASAGVFYPLNWLWLIAAYIVLKTSHEIFHGVISKHYGGDVLEAGVMLVLFIPIGYVNASAAWHFPNKWQRFHTAVAGMFIELLFAGVACWIWVSTSLGPLNNLAYNAIMIAGISTLLFNANPLMRFDGYFALADSMNIPNLYLKGQNYVRYLVQHYLLALPMQDPVIGQDALFIKCYGVAAAIWRLSILVVILVGAYSLFYGAGVVLAVIGAVAFLFTPVLGYIRSYRTANQHSSQLIRTSVRSVAVLLCVFAIVTQVDWQRDIVAPGIVDYAKDGIVRAKSVGFLDEVRVRSGERVKSGQVLARLENKALESELARLQYQLDAARVQATRHLNHAETAKREIELNRISALQETFINKKSLVDGLLLRAPVDGYVLDARIEERLGQHFKVGDEVLRIGQDDDKRLYFTVAADQQIDPDAFGEPLKFKVAMSPARAAQFVRVQHVVPRMTRSAEYPQLTAANGGPLVVIAKTDGEVEFVKPRTEFAAEFLNDAKHLRAGSVAWVRLPSTTTSIAQAILTRLSNWINYLFDRERWR